MAPYLGDLAEDASVTFWWNSNDGSGASITRATDGTVKVERSDGTDATGTSVMDTEDDPDSGIHLCTIDTSDSATFATGYDYAVWVDGAVIDGQTVNACIATFSVENRIGETAADIVTAILAGLADGVAVSVILTRLNALAKGKIARTTDTSVYKKEDGATTAFTNVIESGGRNL